MTHPATSPSFHSTRAICQIQPALALSLPSAKAISQTPLILALPISTKNYFSRSALSNPQPNHSSGSTHSQLRPFLSSPFHPGPTLSPARVILVCLLVWGGGRVSLCSPGCPGTRSVDEAGLELTEIHLPCWNLRHVPPPLYLPTHILMGRYISATRRAQISSNSCVGCCCLFVLFYFAFLLVFFFLFSSIPLNCNLHIM